MTFSDWHQRCHLGGERTHNFLVFDASDATDATDAAHAI